MENYWKKRCELAEAYISECPCDPDITSEQQHAYKKWNDFKENGEKASTSRFYVKISSSSSGDWWYSRSLGETFEVLPCLHRSNMNNMEGVGHLSPEDCFIVASGKSKGNIILKDHCEL